MDILYFGYGSNLCIPRLRDRAPGAVSLGPASLRGYELRWHKRGVDGSGKCSIVASSAPAAVAHGALFTIPNGEKLMLDRIEGLGNGYDETTVWVQSSRGRSSARTYIAAPTHIDDSLRPFSWYKDLVVYGAEAHGLPAEYVDALRRVEACEDHDTQRAMRHMVSLPCRGSG